MFSNGNSFANGNSHAFNESTEVAPVSERYMYGAIWQDRNDK